MVKREELRVLFEDLQLIIVDEFSMVSADALYDIHRRLQEILISDDYFGGCAVLLVGDLLQLPPVKGRKIFSNNTICYQISSNFYTHFCTYGPLMSLFKLHLILPFRNDP